MRIVAVFFLVLVYMMSVMADDESTNAQWPEEMMDNISMDYVTCAAYYAHVASAVKNGGDQESSDRYADIYEEVITLAVVAAQTSRSEEVAIKVTRARLNMMMDAMQEEIENDYSNLSLLLQKHHKRCDFIMNNTEEFMQEWANKSRPE